MNCKPGDLAVFVRSRNGNEGRIVRCLRLATSAEILAWNVLRGDVWWVIDAPIPHTVGPNKPLAQDKNLRPIRDPGEDARDETLEWLPVPSKELA